MEPGMEGPGADAEKAEVEEFEKLTTRVLLNPKDYLVRGVLPLPTAAFVARTLLQSCQSPWPLAHVQCNFLKSIMCCGARNERRGVMGVWVASA